MLLDIPLEVTVEIGTTEMLIEDVLKLNPNSIIELDRYINEPVDLKVNGRVIAKGELYTVKNNFGIRITHIITPEDRLKILER
jgi:flagellar motor switch protein FliN/FliY